MPALIFVQFFNNKIPFEMLVFTTNKKHLLRHFSKDKVLFAYHIGDLDDFYFPQCQWLADYHQRARIEELILVYSGLARPSVLAFGLTERFDELLKESLELLPGQFYCHYFSRHRELFLNLYQEKLLGTYQKMRLSDQEKCGSIKTDEHKSIVRLNSSHVSELRHLYGNAYPENYFNEYMLKSGKYFGYLDEDRIVSAAGVHVISDEYEIAVLGNIATLEEYRGKGLATLLTARLVQELIREKRLITLNVRADNKAAIKCYTNLGFEKTHEYAESYFESRS